MKHKYFEKKHKYFEKKDKYFEKKHKYPLSKSLPLTLKRKYLMTKMELDEEELQR